MENIEQCPCPTFPRYENSRSEQNQFSDTFSIPLTYKIVIPVLDLFLFPYNAVLSQRYHQVAKVVEPSFSAANSSRDMSFDNVFLPVEYYLAT